MTTRKQFTQHWLRTGKDPDGKYIPKMIFGGNEDGYCEWVKKKILEYEIKAQNNQKTHYKWNSENDACQKCKELDGQIFDYEPQRPHPNCNCEIEEIPQEQAIRIYKEHREEIGKRDNVVDHLTQRALPKPSGNCASYVANAFRKNGITIGMPPIRYPNDEPTAPSACDYGPYYEKVGVKPIQSYTHRKSDIDEKRVTGEFPKSYTPQKGDVIVFENSPGHKHGHIAMFDGKQWVSDFKQRDAWGGTVRQYAPSYVVYRHPKWQDWEVDKGNKN